MKWKFKDLKIRGKIRVGFYALMILCVSLGAVSYVTINDIAKNDIQLLSNNNNQYNLILEMRKNEKDFLLHEVTNIEFFETGKSQYIDEFQLNYERFLETIDLIKGDKHISKKPEDSNSLIKL